VEVAVSDNVLRLIQPADPGRTEGHWGNKGRDFFIQGADGKAIAHGYVSVEPHGRFYGEAEEAEEVANARFIARACNAYEPLAAGLDVALALLEAIGAERLASVPGVDAAHADSLLATTRTLRAALTRILAVSP
jgi:hypothetical protein